MKKTKLEWSVKFSRIQILEEDIQTVPVLPLHGESEGRHDLPVPESGHCVQGPDTAGGLEQSYLGLGQHELQHRGRVAPGDAGQVGGQGAVISL